MSTKSITGYQQAILYLNGSQLDDQFCVRNIDKHYVDAVRAFFLPSLPYLQSRREDGKKDYWVIKSRSVRKPSLDDVVDHRGFCRGFIELQGTIDKLWVQSRGKMYWRTRLRVYGSEDDLEFLLDYLPAKPKKIQYIKTHTGQTCQLSYASVSEIADILEWINGVPRSEDAWDKWLTLVPIKDTATAKVDAPAIPFIPAIPRLCVLCGKDISYGTRLKYCDDCAATIPSHQAQPPRNQVCKCIDCGVEFTALGMRGPLPSRCPECRREHEKKGRTK